MQDGVQADTPLNGGIGIFPELGEQFFLPVLVKKVSTISSAKPDKTINIVDGYTQVGVQQADGAAERVLSFRYGFTALLAYIMK